MNEKIRIPHLGILVTTYCNLNCRNCADLIPKRGRSHYELEKIKEDLLRILDVVEFIDEVLVIGGEVMLYPNLIEVLDFCAMQPKIGKLIITTNGTMIPKEAVLTCLKGNSVCVRISGYPEHVVPNRNEVLEKYREYAIEIEDLEHMTWADIGNAHKRDRTPEELQQVFKTCSMRACVSINSEGKMFFCSRQMSSDELLDYPKPKENEYVNVRTSKNLEEDIKAFYKLPYISTCDYCDGISCATTKIVPTATQILNKAIYLEMLTGYETLLNKNISNTEKCEAINMLCRILDKYMMQLYGVKETTEVIASLQKFTNDYSESSYELFKVSYENILNTLTHDYNFSVSENVPYGVKNPIYNRPNCIKLGLYPVDKDADIMLTEDDIENALNAKYPLDIIVYNKLFIESKLKKLQTENITCMISGLSYTQYGILEKKMPVPTVNLSITGNDIPYSVLMAEHALKINPKIEVIVIPMTYYQGCYDMSDDDSQLHKDVVSRINIPILNNRRNFKGSIDNKNGYTEGRLLHLYDIALNLADACALRDEQIRKALENMDFFNEMNQPAPFGGLKFDFHAFETREQKQASAKITAEHNERVCTDKGYREVKNYLECFLDRMKAEGKKVLFFVPPMTTYLYEAYHQELKAFFYDKIVPMLQRYDNVKFKDLAIDKRFTEEDFCDFEHLNSSSGAEKMTQIIGTAITNWYE